MTIRKRYEDYDANNIVICEQEDKIQREGVLSFHDEKKLLKISSTNFSKNVETIKEGEQLEIEPREKEALDLFDENRELQEKIKYGKKLFEEEKEKAKQKIKEEIEKLNNK